MTEWSLRPLSELTENLDSRRVPIKEADRRPGPYPYYGASGIVDYIDDYLFEGQHLLIAEDGENLRTRKLPIAFLADGRFWVNNHAHIVRGNGEANTRFLLYAMLVADVTSYLSGSTMPKLTQGNLNRIPIFAPDKRTQEAIASVLGALDDKIELNRRMNETLEAMARAIFKDWFVDFGPTRAKMEGRAPYLAAEIWSLFPENLDSESKPEGWGERRVEDILELAYGKALKASERTAGPIPVYGSGGITGFHNAALVEGPSIVVGRKGTVGVLYWEDRPFFPIDTVFYVRPKAPLTFCYYHLQTLGLEAMNTDAAVPGLNRNNVYRLPVPWSGDELRNQFDQLVAPLRQRMRANSEETNTLAATRNFLLSKLMSGEVRVKDAEKLIGEAT